METSFQLSLADPNELAISFFLGQMDVPTTYFGRGAVLRHNRNDAYYNCKRLSKIL